MKYTRTLNDHTKTVIETGEDHSVESILIRIKDDIIGEMVEWESLPQVGIRDELYERSGIILIDSIYSRSIIEVEDSERQKVNPKLIHKFLMDVQGNNVDRSASSKGISIVSSVNDGTLPEKTIEKMNKNPLVVKSQKMALVSKTCMCASFIPPVAGVISVSAWGIYGSWDWWQIGFGASLSMIPTWIMTMVLAEVSEESYERNRVLAELSSKIFLSSAEEGAGSWYSYRNIVFKILDHKILASSNIDDPAGSELHRFHLDGKGRVLCDSATFFLRREKDSERDYRDLFMAAIFMDSGSVIPPWDIKIVSRFSSLRKIREKREFPFEVAVKMGGDAGKVYTMVGAENVRDESGEYTSMYRTRSGRHLSPVDEIYELIA